MSPYQAVNIQTNNDSTNCGQLTIATDIQLFQVNQRANHGRNLQQLIVRYEQVAQALAVEQLLHYIKISASK